MNNAETNQGQPDIDHEDSEINKPDEEIESPTVDNEIAVDEKIEVDISSEVGKDLGEFYKIINKKFSDPEDGWTPVKLENNSTEKLAPIIRELREKLIAGGAEEKHADDMIQELINIAQNSDSKESFIDKITNLGNITNKEIINFNNFISQGFEK